MTPAYRPEGRTDAISTLAHRELLAKARTGRIDLYFLGDSITRRWGTTDAAYADLFAHWTANFHGWNAGNFGWGGDTTQNILWRIENGELDRVDPKVIVILAGTNNLGRDSAMDIAKGVIAIVEECRRRAPNARIVLTGIFSRKEFMTEIHFINGRLAAFSSVSRVQFIDINPGLDESMFPDGLHPSVPAYEVWAAALRPILQDALGPRGEVDHAPPATGTPQQL